MNVIEILFLLTLLEMLVCMVWRIICFFRKKGSCNFTKCPFRKDFFSASCLQVTDFACDKCLPTAKEIETQKKTLKNSLSS